MGITIKDGDQEVRVAGRPLTVIFKDKNHLGNLRYPGRVVIDAEAAKYHGDRVQTFHADTERLAKVVFPQLDMPGWAAERERCAPCVAQTVGLIDMTLKLQDRGVPVVWKYPEANLHPAQQCALGDVAVVLSKRTTA